MIKGTGKQWFIIQYSVSDVTFTQVQYLNPISRYYYFTWVWYSCEVASTLTCKLINFYFIWIPEFILWRHFVWTESCCLVKTVLFWLRIRSHTLITSCLYFNMFRSANVHLDRTTELVFILLRLATAAALMCKIRRTDSSSNRKEALLV